MQITESAGAIASPKGGRMLVRLIDAGVGSSGVYPAETLKRAAEEGVFASGTLMFADHPGEAERWDRPERSVRDVAGVLTEAARWDEPTQSLVAEAKTFGPWSDVLAQMHDAIGVSIRAQAEFTEGEDGARVVNHITAAESVDFVTKAGRGGRILSLLESARTPAVLIETAPQDVPVPTGQTHTPESQEDAMPEISEAKLAELSEAAGRVTALTEANAALKTQVDETSAALRQIVETTNRDVAESMLDAADITLNALERKALLADLPLVEGTQRLDRDAMRTRVDEAVAIARESRGAGQVRGFGSIPTEQPTDLTEADIDRAVAAAFGRTIQEA